MKSSLRLAPLAAIFRSAEIVPTAEVRAGDFIFVSGQVGKDENGNMCVGNIEEECRWTLESIRRVLKSASPWQ